MCLNEKQAWSSLYNLKLAELSHHPLQFFLDYVLFTQLAIQIDERDFYGHILQYFRFDCLSNNLVNV